MKIKTGYWAKPIPPRNFDWCAVDDDTYDGPPSTICYGETEREAIQDLLDQLNDFVDYTLEQLDKEGKIEWTTKP